MSRQIRCVCGIFSAMGAMLFLSGCSVYVQQPGQEPPAAAASVDDVDTVNTDAGYQPPPAEVITTYQTDLNPYGHWISDPTYGQCWVPNDTPPGWQPYTVGHWVNSDDGWTWVSDGDEVDWGPVVYHYGCWNQSSGGWCWVPGTTWAPAWVAWREGGGYCGWAPLPPQCAFNSNISPALVDRYCPPNQFIYCNEQYINAPRVDQHIERNNVTIINQTTNITNINITNNHVVNRGVAVANVEHATGRPVEKVAMATATSADEARQMVRSGKPVMYTPPAVRQAQTQRPAAGGRVANGNPPQRQAQPENNPPRNPAPAVENRPNNTAEQPRENPAPPNQPNPREPQNGRARPAPPPAAAPVVEQRKTPPPDSAQPHESEPSVQEKQKPPAESPNRPAPPNPQENKSRSTRTPPPDNAQPHESEPSVQEKQKPPAQSPNRPAPQKPQEQNRAQDNKSNDKAPPQNSAPNKNADEKGKPAENNQKKPDQNGK